MICNSGGALGSDKLFQDLCELYQIQCYAYYIGNRSNWNAPYGNIHCSNNDIEEGKYKVATAARNLWGYQYSTMKDTRLIRNWCQVKYSKQIFAVSTFSEAGDPVSNKPNDTRRFVKNCVSGGTGYAVEMGLQESLEIYVFDQVQKKWFKADYDKQVWTQCETEPVITKDFAGIGTRNLNESGKDAIIDLFVRSFGDLDV